MIHKSNISLKNGSAAFWLAAERLGKNKVFHKPSGDVLMLARPEVFVPCLNGGRVLLLFCPELMNCLCLVSLGLFFLLPSTWDQAGTVRP